MPTDPRSDLHWLALSYVSETLSVEESDAFERRLDRDQEAREAVARVVELVAAVASLSPDERAVGRARRRPPALRRLAYWGAAAACLALAAGLWWTVLRIPPRQSADAALALTWSGIRQAGEQETGDELISWLEEPAAASETDLLAVAEAAPSADGGLPPWLLEAASLRAETPSSGSERKEN